jgi:ectoine hydroxylase-related dioxygenase (phytanoyl-CoA dioxygenase family)
VQRFQEVDVAAEPGSVVFFHFDLFHRSGYNVSDRIRFAATARLHRALAEDYLPGRMIFHPNESVKARRERAHALETPEGA